MPVITFANTKGGAGKTTAVLLLATEFAQQGFRVTVLDADPQRWISRWHLLSPAVPRLNVISYVTQSSIDRHLNNNRYTTDYFIVDLPGAQSPLLAKAIGLSDHVLIPIQGCAMDAQGGANVLELLRYLDEKGGITVPHSVVLTRVNSMVTTRALLAVKMLLLERGVNVLGTPIIERAAFRDIFDMGGTLHTMDETRVSNLDKARQNARAFALEMLRHVPFKSSMPISGSVSAPQSASPSAPSSPPPFRPLLARCLISIDLHRAAHMSRRLHDPRKTLKHKATSGEETCAIS